MTWRQAIYVITYQEEENLLPSAASNFRKHGQQSQEEEESEYESDRDSVDKETENVTSFFLKITLSSVRPSPVQWGSPAEQAAVLTVEDILFHGLK